MMTDHEAQVAWRLFTLNWIPLGLMGLTLALCLALTGFSIRPESLLLPFGAAALFGGVAYVYALARRRDALVSFMLGSTAQLVLIAVLMPPLTYIAAAAGLPMQDANLAHLDRMLGLDWRAYFNFIYDRPALIPYMSLGYAMIVWPMFGIPIVLGMARQYRRLQQFTLACALTLIVTTVISTLLPAMLATPMAGGHYFVDVFAGVAVAVLAIAAAKRLGARLTQCVRAPVAAMSHA